MSNLFSTVFRNFRSLLFDCTLNCRRSIHALPVSGKGSTYDSVLKRKRVVKDLNKPNFEVNKEGLKWTDWRMLRDVKRRYVCAEYYPVRLCLQTVYKNRFLPQIVRESAHKELNELPVNSRWTRLTNRRDYRIVGTFIGSLPLYNHQNTQLGLPLQLLPEEAKILLDENVCEIVKVEYFDNKQLSEKLDEYTKRTFEEYKQLLIKEKQEELKRKADEILEAKRKKNRKSKNLIANKNQFINEEINHISNFTLESFPQQLFTKCPWNDYLQVIEWNYPQTKNEKFKFQVYLDLWRKGHYITNGFKFGCDYLVYEGDPCICHAKYMLICKLPDEELSAFNFLIFGRLSGQVNKQVLIASTSKNETSDKKDEIVYVSFKFEGVNKP
ncbi:tRNA-splicing endonuclease subunit Sen34-like protein [Dinothrombium tinctorium]|uniref:tRNA-intron lyase n=1 Tax=Dinothrombium tinctorium TaxID=1965070 RepID=A0A3S4QZF7_9ACAR|nr:tRNA-splicing endonuclease subunit Sen34-like protein [Dinothrombium tinctorium]